MRNNFHCFLFFHILLRSVDSRLKEVKGEREGQEKTGGTIGFIGVVVVSENILGTGALVMLSLDSV